MKKYREVLHVKRSVLPRSSSIRIGSKLFYIGQCRFAMKSYTLATQYYRRSLTVIEHILSAKLSLHKNNHLKTQKKRSAYCYHELELVKLNIVYCYRV